MNSEIVEKQICAVEKKVINELGLLPITTDPYFMKVWNHLLATEMMLADLTRDTLESAAVTASLAMQKIAESRADALAQQLEVFVAAKGTEIAEHADDAYGNFWTEEIQKARALYPAPAESKPE